MRAIVGVHIAIVVIGVIFGLFGEFSGADQPLPWQAALAALPRAFIVEVVGLGIIALIAGSFFKYMYWLFYLFAILGLAMGLGMATQSVTYGLFLIAGSFGCLLGLPVVSKLHRLRYADAP